MCAVILGDRRAKGRRIPTHMWRGRLSNVLLLEVFQIDTGEQASESSTPSAPFHAMIKRSRLALRIIVVQFYIFGLWPRAVHLSPRAPRMSRSGSSFDRVAKTFAGSTVLPRCYGLSGTLIVALRFVFLSCVLRVSRLHIVFGDRVMVLERGKLMEYASPLELLNDPNSLFYALCKKTGALEQLTETARGEQNEKLAREGDGGGSDEVGLSLSGGEEDAAGGVVGGAKGES